MKVLKFGGSSVATPERIQSVIEIVKPYLTGEVAIVFSAFGGVTDTLIQVSALALEGNLEYKNKLVELEKRHLTAVRELVNIQKQSGILAQVKFMINELEDVLHGVYLVKERTVRTLDYIMSFGERISAYVISEAFKNQGHAAEFLDARDVIRTDANFGHAKVDFEATNKLIHDHFKHHADVQIIHWIYWHFRKWQTTTLGRSGSDYTAAIFAGARHATDLEIWTGSTGMMTAGPEKSKKSIHGSSDDLRGGYGTFAFWRESNIPLYHAARHGKPNSDLD